MVEIVSLGGVDRPSAIPVLVDSFTGIYRWHAKRTLGEATWVRAANDRTGIVGVALLDHLTEQVGYVYYIAVLTRCRHLGVGGALLDDALRWLMGHGERIVYAVVTEGNTASERLFRSRAFRPIERQEAGFQEGGLGAWGLRSRMRIVGGEVLMGRRLEPGPTSIDPSLSHPL